MGVLRLNQLTPYGRVAWGEIAGDSHPLELLLKRGVSVYFKFNRELYFARTKAAIGARIHPGPPRQDKRPNLIGWKSDSDVFLLRLDEDNIRELIKTGTCGVVTFSLGGLKLDEADSGPVSGLAAGENSPCNRLDEVDFMACFLVDKRRWSDHVRQLSPKTVFLRHEDFAYHPKVGTEDLYIENQDLAMLRREAAECVDAKKPGPLEGRGLQPAMQLLYDVSIAFNTGKILWRDRAEGSESARRYAAIVEWLERNSQKAVSKRTWKRTVKTIVPENYNRSACLREALLPSLPEELKIPRDHLSVAVYCALTIAQWWQLRSEAEQGPDEELGSWLIEVGFKSIAVIDIVSMITGSKAKHETEDIDKFIKEANRILNLRERKRRKSSQLSTDGSPWCLELLANGAAQGGQGEDEPDCGEVGDLRNKGVLAPRV